MFPNRVVVDNVVKNISKRSNCLDCSPFDNVVLPVVNCVVTTDPKVIKLYKDDMIVVELWDNGMVTVETSKKIISLSPSISNPIISQKPDPLKELGKLHQAKHDKIIKERIVMDKINNEVVPADLDIAPWD